MIAFERFEEINAKDTAYKKQKEWLKDYEGFNYSKAEYGNHRMDWKRNPQTYTDKKFSPDINCIGERGDRTRIDFDDKTNGEKDSEKIKINIEKTIEKLKANNIGFIRSSHHGSSDYLWVEFDRDVSQKEKESFLLWIAPEDSIIDLNFSFTDKIFPVLFAVHWKHSMYREEPIDFFKGNKINLEELKIEIKEEDIQKKKVYIKKQNFQYVTGIKKASQVFRMNKQAKQFNDIQPIFYDRAGMFWLWNCSSFCWEIVDEVDILNMIFDSTGKDIISPSERTKILNSLKQEGRLNIPKPMKKTWIQFRNKVYDYQTGENFEATPEYFVTNPLPYDISSNPETPVMDKIFGEWVGEKNIEMLYEIIAYCCLQDYPINRLFCFIGRGLNGKSCFLNLLRKFIGEDNISSTELDALISSRFEVTRLHKKLVCMMGETNFNEISKTSILKKLTGGDLIGFEYKNKNPFEDTNYAKIIIATNNLPTTTDKTIGFYRRWLIIDFPNSFSEKKNILLDIPEEEYSNLATKSIITLNKLMEKREFTNEGTVEERMERYESKSNFLEKFINSFTYEDVNGYITKADFYKKFIDWSKENRFRDMSETSVGLQMKKLGIESSVKHFDWMFDGKGGFAKIWIGMKWKT